MGQLNLTCACGAVSCCLDERKPPSGIRYICHCDDCQAFATLLGTADRILDEGGGTDAYQLPASRVQITQGRGHLACLQLTSRPLLRWYCDQCRTPVANTYATAKFSFVSLPIPLARRSEADRVLGLPKGHVWTKFGRGDLSRVRQINIPAMLWRMASRIIAARLTGDFRRNPFFDPATARPIATPRQIPKSERAELDRKVQLSSAA